MKIGFIGFGKSANLYHLPFISTIDKLEVMGYFVPFKSNNSYNYQIKRYKSTVELYKNCDLVVITTPPFFHFEYAKEAILNNKNVLVEKPFCFTVEEAKFLFELAKNKKVKICPYQNRRYDSDFLTIKYILNNYNLGSILEIESNYTQYRKNLKIYGNSCYDGAIYCYGVHYIDQIISLFGEPEDLVYDTTNQHKVSLNIHDYQKLPEDFYDLKFIYKDMRVRIKFSSLNVKASPRWLIHTTESTIIKESIDRQEIDILNGILVGTPEFGRDLPDNETTINFFDKRKIKINTIYGTYAKFYNELLLGLIPVKEREVLIVLNIMETIVKKKKYKKLVF